MDDPTRAGWTPPAGFFFHISDFGSQTSNINGYQTPDIGCLVSTGDIQMKTVLILCGLLIGMSANAFIVSGTDYGSAQTNCNLASGGAGGQIRNCSFSNGSVVCDCEPNATQPGRQCYTASGTDYGSTQTNCMLESNGQGSISNCSFSNGSVVCSCCW